MEWSREAGQIQNGIPTPLRISAEMSSTPESPALSGSGLWKANLFGSRNMDGSGDRVAERTQILDGYNQAKPLVEGGVPIEFTDITTNFPMEELGCGDVNYLCLELTKGDYPNPKYPFATSTGEESVINCKEEECRGITICFYFCTKAVTEAVGSIHAIINLSKKKGSLSRDQYSSYSQNFVNVPSMTINALCSPVFY